MLPPPPSFLPSSLNKRVGGGGQRRDSPLRRGVVSVLVGGRGEVVYKEIQGGGAFSLMRLGFDS